MPNRKLSEMISEDKQSLEYKNEVLTLDNLRLRDALQKIIDEGDDLAANPFLWSSTIAKQALGWTFKDGQAFPPKPNISE